MLYNLNAFQSFPISSFYADYCLERIISHIFLFSYGFWTLCRVLGVALGVATSLCPLPALCPPSATMAAANKNTRRMENL